MKKTYIVPEVQVVKIALTSMVAESLLIDPEEEGGGALTREDKGWDIWGDDYNE